jgi:hypothetical protein
MPDKSSQTSLPQQPSNEIEDRGYKVKHTIALKIAYVLTVLFLGLIFLDPNMFLIQKNPLKGSIAIVLERSNDVKVKHPKGATWSSLKSGDKLYPNSMVFTGENSRVIMNLEDNSIIEQGPESLLRLKIIKKFNQNKNTAQTIDSALQFTNSFDKKLVDEGEFESNDGVNIEIDSGNIAVRTSSKSKINSIQTRDSSLQIAAGSEVNIKNEGSTNTQISMIKGAGVLSVGKGNMNNIKLKKNDSISTKKIKSGNPNRPEDAIEKTNTVSSINSVSGEEYQVIRGGIWQTLKKMGRIILFMD